MNNYNNSDNNDNIDLSIKKDSKLKVFINDNKIFIFILFVLFIMKYFNFWSLILNK